MAQTAVTSPFVYPSANDIATVAGDGSTPRERSLTDLLLAYYFSSGFVVSGLTKSAIGGLVVRVAAGIAVIKGRHVETGGNTDVTVDDNATTHFWLRFLRDGGDLALSVKIETNTSGTDPGDAAYLGYVISTAGAITTNSDGRDLYPINPAIMLPPAEIVQAMLAKPCVGTPELKTATGSVVAADSGDIDVTLNDYSFSPSLSSQGGTAYEIKTSAIADPASTVGRFTISAPGGSLSTVTARWRYMTASDNPTIWVARDTTTGQIKAVWVSDDPTPNDQPGVRMAGCESVRLTAEQLQALPLSDVAFREADERIVKQNLKPQHRLFRALQFHAGDPAPADWLLKHAAMSQDGELYIPNDLQEAAKVKR